MEQRGLSRGAYLDTHGIQNRHEDSFFTRGNTFASLISTYFSQKSMFCAYPIDGGEGGGGIFSVYLHNQKNPKNRCIARRPTFLVISSSLNFSKNVTIVATNTANCIKNMKILPVINRFWYLHSSSARRRKKLSLFQNLGGTPPM